MKKLTKRQNEVLQFIKDFIADEGYPPTRANICNALGFRSPNAAEDHLKALSKKGWIEMLSGSSRGIRVIPESNQKSTFAGLFDGIPLIGQVAAGSPILAEEHIEDTYKIPPEMFSPKADFLLRVKGMSMKDVGILDGDLLAVNKTLDVHEGQIIVARLEDEVTVKRLKREKGKIILLPENTEFSPIIVNPEYDHIEIEGLAVGVLRNEIFH